MKAAGKTDPDDALAIRHANADLLSLALIDARNHTLMWLAHFESQQALTQMLGHFQ